MALNKRKENILQLRKNLDFLADLNNGAGVTKHEFVLEILLHLEILDREKDVLPWIKVIVKIDYLLLDSILFALSLSLEEI